MRKRLQPQNLDLDIKQHKAGGKSLQYYEDLEYPQNSDRDALFWDQKYVWNKKMTDC